MNKLKFSLFLLAPLLLASCELFANHSKTIEGEGEIVTVTYKDIAADKIAVRDIARRENKLALARVETNFYCFAGDTPRIEVTTQESLIEKIKVGMEGDVLTVKADKKEAYLTEKIVINFYGYQMLKNLSLSFAQGEIHIDAPFDYDSPSVFTVSEASDIVVKGAASSVDKITVKEASQLIWASFAGESLEAEVNSASKLYFNMMTCTELKATSDNASIFASLYSDIETLECEIDNASRAVFGGRATSFKAKARNASFLEADKMVADSADISLSNVSEGHIGIDGSLTYKLSNLSSLYYYGNPSSLNGEKDKDCVLEQKNA